MKTFDVAIIGAGPAGMATAVEADKAGLSAIVLDEQPAPGGQIFRGIEQADARRLEILGKDYAKGRTITNAFRRGGIDYLPGATVWNIDSDLSIDFSRPGGSSQVGAKSLVVATGAIERPTPMHRMDTPRSNHGGRAPNPAQAHGMVGDDVVFIRSGPLLWLISSQMVEAGVRPKAIVETVPRSRYLAAARHLGGALRVPAYLRKGMALMWKVRRAGVPVYRDARQIQIEGTGHAEAVAFTSRGEKQRIETGSVALHQGVVPNQQITRLLRCEHLWDAGQRCFVPRLDTCFEASVANVYVAGDGAGIAGTTAAILRGCLVALRIAEKMGRAQVRDRAPIGKPQFGRCSRRSTRPRPKSCCQGRMCGLAVTEIIAARRGEQPSVVDYYRIRPPLKPLTLAELAALEVAPETIAAP